MTHVTVEQVRELDAAWHEAANAAQSGDFAAFHDARSRYFAVRKQWQFAAETAKGSATWPHTAPGHDGNGSEVW